MTEEEKREQIRETEMTAHELARLLLAGPNLEVWTDTNPPEDDEINYPTVAINQIYGHCHI